MHVTNVVRQKPQVVLVFIVENDTLKTVSRCEMISWSLNGVKLMFNESENKNPFFLPALIMTFFPNLFFIFHFDPGYLILLVIPTVTIILSLAGLVTAINKQKRFIGCFLCLVLSIIQVIIFYKYMSFNIHHECPTIMTHSLSPEESASIESINEEIDRAVNGDTIIRNTIFP